jgi:hypothetical protein
MEFTEETLRKFVEDCHKKYDKEGWIGPFEMAHHPLPRCLGGTDMVKLEKPDHCIHDVIQSEVYQQNSFYGNAIHYLVGEWEFLIPIFKKWKRITADENRPSPEFFRRLALERSENGTLPAQISSKEGTHPWQTEEWGDSVRKRNIEKYENGTHYCLTEKHKEKWGEMVSQKTLCECGRLIGGGPGGMKRHKRACKL